MNPITTHTSITSSSNASIEHNHQHRSKRGGCKYPFPQRLFDLLEEADDDVEHNKHVLSSIISWNPNGKHFRVHDRKEFEKIIQKKYFNQSKYASFRRQLNLWGFERIPDQDEDSSSVSSLYGGCFFHPLFQRNSRSLCCTMSRAVGSNGSKVPSTNTFVLGKRQSPRSFGAAYNSSTATRSGAHDGGEDASPSLAKTSTSGHYCSLETEPFPSFPTSMSPSQRSDDGLDGLEPYDLMYDHSMLTFSSSTNTQEETTMMVVDASNTLLPLLNSSTLQEDNHDLIPPPLGVDELLLEQQNKQGYGLDKGDDSSSPTTTTNVDDKEFQELIAFLSANDDNIQKYLFESEKV